MTHICIYIFIEIEIKVVVIELYMCVCIIANIEISTNVYNHYFTIFDYYKLMLIFYIYLIWLLDLQKLISNGHEMTAFCLNPQAGKC